MTTTTSDAPTIAYDGEALLNAPNRVARMCCRHFGLTLEELTDDSGTLLVVSAAISEQRAIGGGLADLLAKYDELSFIALSELFKPAAAAGEAADKSATD